MDIPADSDLSEPRALRDLAGTDPASAVLRAREYLQSDRSTAAGQALAWSAAARALFDLGRHGEAIAAARESLAGARHLDRPSEIILVLSLSAVLAESGDVEGALAILDDLATAETGTSLGRILVQQAFVLHNAGHLRAALESLDRAEPCFGPDADRTDELRLLLNRGLVLLQQGRLEEAESDFLRALDLARSVGRVTDVALCHANLGVLYGRARRLRDATASFAAAEEAYRRAGDPARSIAFMQIDRAETMLHHGLIADAVDGSRIAVQLAEPTGNRVLLGDAQLMHARALSAAGSPRSAGRAADVAAASMRVTGRERMVRQARAVAVDAALRLATEPVEGAPAIADAIGLAAELRADGWVQLASQLQASAVRAARRLGALHLVADDVELLRLGAFATDRDVLLAGWYSEAVARAAAGDRAGGIDACRSGLGLLDDIVAEAPTLEQRSAAMRLGADLSQLAIELAVELDDADTVLAAAEGTRARALHDELADPRRHRPLTESGAEQLRRELSARLAGRVLVEWIEVGDDLVAVVFDASGSRLVRVGELRRIVRERDRTRMWLGLAAERPDASSANALRAAALLDDLLIGPLGLADHADLVVVPVGATHDVPWSGLPSLAGRSVSLVPNARLWLAADRRASGAARGAGLIVGPDIASADVERTAVESLKLDVSIAAGAGATAATVRSMFASLDVVHVAAHGTFRSDHPLLSTLRLHGGEATLYDTVPDRVASRLVVLSSCEGGAHGSSDGSEVLGLGAVMLARGAASVLAPLTVVRELECADFVADVHAQLAGRVPIGAAVATVRGRWLADDDLSRWAVASSFTCFGSDAVTVG